MAVIDPSEPVPLDGRLGSAAMEASSNATGVSPEGVRAGDRAALQTLVDRRGPSVVAFCTQVCGPNAAPRAAAEAFARFRAAVRDTPDDVARDPEALLRGATRHAAASMARTPLGPPPHGKLRSRGTETCAYVPTMLAARANGALGEADIERLGRHLERCERCAALAEIFHRAELAYQDPPFDTLGTETSSVLIDAMLNVSVHGLGTAPAPGPDAPATEPLDGAFGHLPELEDEVPIVELVPDPEPVEPAAEEHDDDLDDDEEWTYEFDVVAPDGDEPEAEAPDAAPAPAAAGEEAALVVLAAPAPASRRRRRGLWRALRVGVPALLVAGAIALGFALTADNDPTPVTDAPPAVKVERPVLTPLPLTVPARAATTP